MPVTTRPPRLSNLSYEDLRSWTNLLGGDVDKYIDAINSGGYDVSELQAVEDLASGYMDFYKTADGTYTVTQFREPFQQTVTNPIDSNVSTVSRGNISQMLNRGKDAITGKLQISKFPVSGSFTSQASYVLGSVGSALGAVSAGIALGKTIDSSLYNLNPNFWDSAGMSGLNPDTWNNITNGDDSNFAGLFNFILGLDPTTGNSQAYMDERAFAYMAYWMSQQGIFNSATPVLDDYTDYPNLVAPVSKIIPVYETYTFNNVDYKLFAWGTDISNSNIRVIGYKASDYPNGLPEHSMTFATSVSSGFVSYIISFDSDSAVTNLINGYISISSNALFGSFGLSSLVSTYKSNIVSYYLGSFTANTIYIPYEIGQTVLGGNVIQEMAHALRYGSYTTPSSIEGIGNQEGATIPNVSDWDSYEDVLPSLQQQYPDLFANPLIWDNVQPDGTNPQLRYIPVTLPFAINNTDTQPTTGTQTQTQTIINPNTSAQTLLDLVTQLATKTQTDSDPSIPPQNPVDTGTGGTPTPVSPSGSASALWSVYHPTQEQVDSFGAWLWTGDIITQIQQVLQNPMEGIITLHKVFASPVDSGTGTIVVGRLDSHVSSSTVTQQYVTVDCGSIDCKEYFANIFDYSPHTSISLYLPFIGIVPLNTDDVMRSTINVKYGVDVFTGACLAMVEVSRDGNTVNMYQYSGVASVEYPLTGSVHSGLISGLLGLASGAAGVAMASTGVGAVAGITTMAGGILGAGKSNNARSGGFSGNSGAMGIKIPYLIIERPQTKVADLFPTLSGYPTNVSNKLQDFSGQVNVSYVHVEGINATDVELKEIESLLKSGVLV